MTWKREAISDGEIDALRRVALAACNDDTRYPAWHGSPDHAGGHCYVISRWLVHRLGGSIGQRRGHYVWLAPDSSYYLDLTGGHRTSVRYLPNDGEFRAIPLLDNERTDRFTKRANRLFDSLDRLLRLSLDYAGDAYPAEEPQRADDLDRFDDSWTDPSQYWHDEPDPSTPEGIYQFVYCNPAEAPIWMADLSFKDIAAVAIGDEIVGWEFNDQAGSVRRRRLTRGAVTALHQRTAAVVKITMASGRSLRCTADHRWLNFRNSKNGVPRDVERFTVPKIGKTLVHVIDPTPSLSAELHRAAAWLGGIFDGEGSAGRSQAVNISQCSRVNGSIHQHILHTLGALGLPCSTNGKDIWLTGGRQTDVNFANWVDPVKRDRIANGVFGERWRNPDEIIAIEPDGEETVYGLTTTTGNYVAWGYASKNCNGQLEVSPNHSHEELAGHAGVIPAQHIGPFATGHVVVTTGKATWEVQANVNLHALFRIFKDASKNYGWQWGGMTDASGQPIIEDFAPKKSATVLRYAFVSGHLYLGRTSAADLAVGAEAEGPVLAGTVRILGTRVEVAPVHIAALPHLFEWAEDSGFTLYAGNDNVIKTIPDLELGSEYNPQTTESPNPAEPPAVDERLPTGLYRCPGCTQLFPNWHEYQKHRREQESWGDPDRSNNGDRGLPEPDHDLYGDGAHYHEMHQEPGITTGKVVVLPARTWREAARVDGFAKYAKAFNYDNDDYRFYVAYRNGDPLGYVAVTDTGGIHMMHSAIENEGIGQAIYQKLTKHYDLLWTHAAHEKTASLLRRFGWVQVKGELWKWAKDQAATDMLEGPVPFIYDVQEDKIHVGHPGARTSDIPGRFTPGGIVEGNYEPGGKVVVRSLTSIPYTVRHMIELWYYTHPQLEVKSVHLQDDQGKDTRLASQDVGTQVKTLAAMDPAVHVATIQLQSAGGQVFAVGGAVRDVVLGKDPSDIDLMVSGLPEARVAHLLGALPGNVVQEGQDFKVFHYHYKGHEVHIALPRTERSTGAGHRDFEVQSNHTMGPEEDFSRRDYTANAIGVDLGTGQVVDPYHGVDDIRSGILKATTSKTLAEDPLRVLRGIGANARHGLHPDESTRTQMADNAHMLQHLPTERIQAELDKIFASEHPARALRLAHETGVLKHVLPEVDAAFGFDQHNPHHELELGDHLLNVLDRASEKTKDPDLRLAALLHDIGKPESAWPDPETGSFHYYEHHRPDGTVLGKDHETHGADLARERMNHLHYPNERINRVSELIRHHMWAGFTTDRGARRFLNRVGDHADDLFDLRWADQGGKSVYPTDSSLNVDNQRRLVARVRNAGEATTQSQLAINGHDLIAAGISPGPRMGQILRDLTSQVVDDPSLNDRDTLLQLAQQPTRIVSSHEEPTEAARRTQEATEVEALSPRVRLSESQKLAQGDEEAEVAPAFPSAAEAQAIHDQAVLEQGQPYAALPDPGKLESAMGRAPNYWHYGEGTPGERTADAAGALAHGIGMSQAFVDGNKKTAYHTTRYFLHNNGYGHLSPVDADDEELADHLVGHGEGTHRLEDTQQLFRSRLRPEGQSQ